MEIRLRFNPPIDWYWWRSLEAFLRQFSLSDQIAFVRSMIHLTKPPERWWFERVEFALSLQEQGLPVPEPPVERPGGELGE